MKKIREERMMDWRSWTTRLTAVGGRLVHGFDDCTRVQLVDVIDVRVPLEVRLNLQPDDFQVEVPADGLAIPLPGGAALAEFITRDRPRLGQQPGPDLVAMLQARGVLRIRLLPETLGGLRTHERHDLLVLRCAQRVHSIHSVIPFGYNA